MVNSREYKFEPGAMSIIQMGEELIGHPSTAINELVKNAYDADADRCWVYTQYDKNPEKNFIIIKDNGLGMDEDTLFGNWLRPSISSKRDIDRDARKSEIYERKYLGSKGIGRLASMALGRYLTVVTKKSFEEKYNWLHIDRESFRSEDLLFNVTFPGGKISDYRKLFSDSDLLSSFQIASNANLNSLLISDPFINFKEGTTIILQDLDDSVKTIIEDEFNHREIDETTFFKSLRDLITPLKLNKEIQDELVTKGILNKALNTDNGSGTFELLYGINFIKDQSRQKIEFLPVEPSPIIQFYDYRVFGKVTSDYEVDGRYICRRLEDDKRDEEFQLPSSYVLSDDNLQVRKAIDRDSVSTQYKDAKLGEFYFDIRVYDLDDDAKDKMVGLLKASGRREATQIFGRYLGLRISKNGFGVKPYGEEEQDWLGLGAKRVNKHIVTIGPNQIIGYTFLYSPQNDQLSEKTNREGFFENKAFIVFKKILGGILSEAGQRRAKYREIHQLGRSIKSKINRPDSNRFIEYILQNYSEGQELLRISKEFIDDTNVALENLEDSLSFSQRLASLGTGLELVYHELSQPLNAMGASLNSLKINVENLADEKLKNRMLDRIKNILLSLDTLESLKESLQPAIGRSMPRNFKPVETFKKVCSLFENTMADKNIRLVISERLNSVEIKDIEYIFWISFLNILNNAVYWLKYSEKDKLLCFDLENEDTFIISNSGPTIPEEDLDIIFSYGITGKQEKNATGLGLAFTRSMLSSRGWGIWAENMDYGPAFFIKKDSNRLTQ